MVRRWAVRPDQELHLQDGRVLYIVSRDARVQAFIDAEAVQEQCGGFISAQSVRTPTEVPGEMATTLLIMEWRDRTDAKDQPERPAPVAVATPPEQEAGRGEAFVVPATDAATAERVTADLTHRPLADPVGDGLDPATLEEEDFDSVPESAR